jgi:ABC-2 type transport system permease protein
VVATLTARAAARSGAVWGAVFGIAIASSALSYTSLYSTQAQRDALAAAYGANTATSALFGPAPQLQTVGGFTAFKISMTLMVLGAVWGLLTSTRLLRGEEDEGRWELLLAGQATRRGATAQALAGLGLGVATLWGLTAVLTVLTGRDAKVEIGAGAALFFALAMVATAAMFVGVGACTSQLAATRRQAAAYAAAFLGLSYAVRLVADAGVGLHGLIWASPLGWVEELQALTAPRPVALLPIVVFTGLTAGAAVSLTGARDVGASVLPDRASRRTRRHQLSGPVGLAVRMVRPTVLGWWLAIASMSLLYGLVAKSAGGTISGSSVQQVFSKLGATGSGARAVLGVCFLFVAALVALVGAGQLSAARAEESAGRLEHLLARPVSRTRWLGGRLSVAVVALVVSGVGAGVFAWLGATSEHAGVSFGALLGAGVNVVPPALAILGIGVLAYGLWPRAASIIVYSVIGWSLLVVVVGGIGATNHFLLDTSVFHQMTSAPAASPDWVTNGALCAVGAVGALAGAVAFGRRDLQGA